MTPNPFIKNRQHGLFLAAIVCVGLLLSDRLVWTPLSDAWKRRSERVQALKSEVERGRLILEREKVLQEKWRQMKNDALPPGRPEAENAVFQAVDRWAQNSGVGFTSLKPDWRLVDEGFQALECRTDAFGSVEEIARFLHEMETDPLALRAEKVRIDARDEQGRTLNLHLQFSGIQWNKENG